MRNALRRTATHTYSVVHAASSCWITCELINQIQDHLQGDAELQSGPSDSRRSSTELRAQVRPSPVTTPTTQCLMPRSLDRPITAAAPNRGLDARSCSEEREGTG